MKICTKCLTLHDGMDECPTCGSGLVPYGLWKKQLADPSVSGPAAPRTHDEAAKLTPPAAIGPATTNIEQKDQKDGREGEKFVLGIFLSSLAFFIAFVAAYIVVTLSK